MALITMVVYSQLRDLVYKLGDEVGGFKTRMKKTENEPAGI
jgi:hypothetical protein